jgi:hypothetical protein
MKTILLALPAALLLGAAGPSLEYAHQVEADFIRACTAEGAGLSACHCLEETMQARLGYAIFIEAAASGMDAFRGSSPYAADAEAAERACLAADRAEPARPMTRWAGAVTLR